MRSRCRRRKRPPLTSSLTWTRASPPSSRARQTAWSNSPQAPPASPPPFIRAGAPPWGQYRARTTATASSARAPEMTDVGLLTDILPRPGRPGTPPGLGDREPPRPCVLCPTRAPPPCLPGQVGDSPQGQATSSVRRPPGTQLQGCLLQLPGVWLPSERAARDGPPWAYLERGTHPTALPCRGTAGCTPPGGLPPAPPGRHVSPLCSRPSAPPAPRPASPAPLWRG